MRRLAVIALVMLLGGTARAGTFDPEGWTLYAKVIVEPSEHVIVPTLDAPEIDEIAIVVNGTQIGIEKVLVKGDGEPVEVGANRGFDATAVDWTLSLATRMVPTSIEIDAGKGEGAAFVRVFARDSTIAVPTRVNGKDSAWHDSSFWRFGSAYLDGHRTDATIDLDARLSVTTLVLAASGGDLAVRDLVITFDGGKQWAVPGAYSLDDAAREASIVISQEARGATRMDFRYRISSGTAVTLDVHGSDELPAKAPDGEVVEETVAVAASQTTKRAAKSTYAWSAPRHALPAPTDDDGWTLLGEDDVDLVEDEIVITRKKSTWSKVKIVVDGDDVTLEAVEIVPAGKKAKFHHEDLEQAFSDGAARIIEIPGKRRAIQKVRLTYGKHRLDASTRVQVYAR